VEHQRTVLHPQPPHQVGGRGCHIDAGDHV
jgi:hypothetical protein